MFSKLFKLGAIASITGLVALSSSHLMAATQGSLGNPSVGDKSISVTIAVQARITNIADIAFGTWSGSGALTDNDDVCVYSNGSGGGYEITATGSGTAGAFTLLGSGGSGDGTTMAYNVFWHDSTGGTPITGDSLTTGVALTGQTSGAANDTCGGGDSATVSVEIPEATLFTALDSTYSGTLTLSIAPE